MLINMSQDLICENKKIKVIDTLNPDNHTPLGAINITQNVQIRLGMTKLDLDKAIEEAGISMKYVPLDISDNTFDILYESNDKNYKIGWFKVDTNERIVRYRYNKVSKFDEIAYEQNNVFDTLEDAKVFVEDILRIKFGNNSWMCTNTPKRAKLTIVNGVGNPEDIGITYEFKYNHLGKLYLRSVGYARVNT